MLRYSSTGLLAISLSPDSYLLVLGDTAKSLIPASRALSALDFMPPQGLPVTCPSVITTAKRTRFSGEAWATTWEVMLDRAQSVKVPRPRYSILRRRWMYSLELLVIWL